MVGRMVRRAGLLIAVAAACVAAEAMAQQPRPTATPVPTPVPAEGIEPNRVTGFEILRGGDEPIVKVSWIYTFITHRDHLPDVFRVVLGPQSGGNPRERLQASGGAPNDADATVITVSSQCWVDRHPGQNEYSCTLRSSPGVTPSIAPNRKSVLRVYGYALGGVRDEDISQVDLDPVLRYRDYLRLEGTVDGVMETGLDNHAIGHNNSGAIYVPAIAFPQPEVQAGQDLSRDGGVVPQAGRPIDVQLENLTRSTRYILVLTLAFAPSITTEQAAAASGWDGVCGRGAWWTSIAGQTEWTAIARLRACGRPPWPAMQTGTVTLTYALGVQALGPVQEGQPPPLAAGAQSGALIRLQLIYPEPTPTPRPTAAAGEQPVADTWFDPVASVGEDVIGLGGDTTKAALVGALAMGAVIMAYKFSGSIGVSVLGGVLVVIGGVPIGLTPIWVLAGTALAGIVVSGFTFFFRGDGL